MLLLSHRPAMCFSFGTNYNIALCNGHCKKEEKKQDTSAFNYDLFDGKGKLWSFRLTFCT